jgi:hypothetical protein
MDVVIDICIKHPRGELELDSLMGAVHDHDQVASGVRFIAGGDRRHLLRRAHRVRGGGTPLSTPTDLRHPGAPNATKQTPGPNFPTAVGSQGGKTVAILHQLDPVSWMCVILSTRAAQSRRGRKTNTIVSEKNDIPVVKKKR